MTLKLSNKKDQGIYNKSELIQLPNSKLKQILSIKNIFIKENNLSFEFYTCDETALKTVVRSNPGAIVLKAGNVIDKKHYKDFSYLNFD